MFFPEGQIRVHLYGEPVDMRKSFTGLYALTRAGLKLDPLSGDLFVFISRRATMMKVMYFDRSGFCVWAKRLEAGRFISDWSQVRTREMDWTALKLLLEGIEPGRLRKRFRYTASAQKPTPAASHAINFTHAERAEDLPEHCRDRAHAER
jgi:transposase